MKKEINVVVTGAAGQIGYSLIPRLIDGNLFKDTIVNLSLVEIPQVVEKLEGLAMELDDSYFPHLGSIDIYDDFSAASHNGNWFLLVGSIPRGIVYKGKKIEERSDLLKIEQGELDILSEYLPKQLSEADTEKICKEIIKNSGASSLKDMGRVMGELKKNHADTIDFSKAKQLVTMEQMKQKFLLLEILLIQML